MIYLLSGPDIVSSRTFLSKLRKDYSDCLTIDAGKQNKSKINIPKEANLFGEKRLIIVENLVPTENQPFEKNENRDIVIWTKETINPPTWVDKSWNFKQTDTLSNFKLADNIVSGQKKSALFNLKKLLEQKIPAELIIGSLVRQFRLISLVLSGEENNISKSNFVVDKTKTQAKDWTIKKIKKALLLTLKFDWELKNGIINNDSGLIILVEQLCNLQKD